MTQKSTFTDPDILQKGEQRPHFRKMIGTKEIKHNSLGKGFTCPYCGAKNHFNPYVYMTDFRQKREGEVVDAQLFGHCFNASCPAGQSAKGIYPSFDNGYRYSMAGYPDLNISNPDANTYNQRDQKPNQFANKLNTQHTNLNAYPTNLNTYSPSPDSHPSNSHPFTSKPNSFTSNSNSFTSKPNTHFSTQNAFSSSQNALLPLLPQHYDLIDRGWIAAHNFFSNFLYGSFCGYDCEMMDYLLSLGYSRQEIMQAFCEMKVSGSFYKQLTIEPLPSNDDDSFPPSNHSNARTLRIKGTVYWYLDEWGGIRTGKIIYSLHGHRISKKNTPEIPSAVHSLFSPSWVHYYYKQLPDNTEKDFRAGVFGLPRLCKMMQQGTLSSLPICLYESEKTALMMTLECPSAVHLAVGGEQNFKYDILMDLFSLGVRCLVAYPDKGYYDSWQRKAHDITSQFSHLFPLTSSTDRLYIHVSDILEQPSFSFLPDNSDLGDLIDHLRHSKNSTHEVSAVG